MALSIRRLLPSEWPRLASVPTLKDVWRLLPEGAVVLAVEDGDAIVGAWSLSPMWLAEGVWIASEYRGGATALMLLRAMRQAANDRALRVLITTADTDEVRGLLARIEAEEVPVTLHKWVM